MTEILACPHCGGRAAPEQGLRCQVFCRCRLCGARGSAYKFRIFNEDSYLVAEYRAIRAWNRRIGLTGQNRRVKDDD